MHNSNGLHQSFRSTGISLPQFDSNATIPLNSGLLRTQCVHQKYAVLNAAVGMTFPRQPQHAQLRFWPEIWPYLVRSLSPWVAGDSGGGGQEEEEGGVRGYTEYIYAHGVFACILRVFCMYSGVFGCIHLNIYSIVVFMCIQKTIFVFRYNEGATWREYTRHVFSVFLTVFHYIQPNTENTPEYNEYTLKYSQEYSLSRYSPQIE